MRIFIRPLLLTTALFLLLSLLCLPKVASAKESKSLIPNSITSGFHTATVANTHGNYTDIDNFGYIDPQNPVFVTQVLGSSVVYNNHPVGVWYNASVRQWSIFNEDGATMPVGAKFAIQEGLSPNFAGHIATSADTFGNYTNFNHSYTNGNPNALVVVTQNWNPGGLGGVYNPHPVGVWYNTSAGEWSIFNEDGASMPVGASFNVFFSLNQTNHDFVQNTSNANIVANYAIITASSIADNVPNVFMQAIPNWNPGGVGGSYHNHNIGLWYNSFTGKWTIFNEDSSAMSTGVAFNVEWA